MSPPLGNTSPTPASYGAISSPSLMSNSNRQEQQKSALVQRQYSSILDSIRSITRIIPQRNDDDDDDDDYSTASSLQFADDEHELALQEELLQKTQFFTLEFNPDKGYRATQLNVFSMARPHMRAFHASWLCFFCSWLLWFSVAPLLPYVQESLSTPDHPVTNQDIWTSNLWSMAGAVVLRLILGPLCDQHGGRVIITGVLAVCAVLCGTLGLAQDFNRFLVWRALLGCVGGTLVPAQYWITAQFVPAICGTTMAVVAGWGAMGGGVAQIFMGSFVFPTCLQLVDGDADLAWRIALLVPAVLSLLVAFWCYQFADDGPLGNMQEVQKVL